MVSSDYVKPPIIKREKKEIEFMVKIYCNAKHKSKGNLCSECLNFLSYAKDRLNNCPYQAKKPVCGVCQLSCYSPGKKEKGLKIFYYSGPRMMYKHPILAIRHIIDGLKNSQKPDLIKDNIRS